VFCRVDTLIVGGCGTCRAEAAIAAIPNASNGSTVEVRNTKRKFSEPYVAPDSSEFRFSQCNWLDDLFLSYLFSSRDRGSD
jgi:hypothetical protein